MLKFIGSNVCRADFTSSNRPYCWIVMTLSFQRCNNGSECTHCHILAGMRFDLSVELYMQSDMVRCLQTIQRGL